MQTIEFIDPISVILSNTESLPQPKFNICDWVIWKDTPTQYRDKGIVTGFFYETAGAEEIMMRVSGSA